MGWGQRSEYKPWLKESMLSSQSEADSTRRDGVREKTISTVAECQGGGGWGG